MKTPAEDFRRTHIIKPEKLHTGLDAFVNAAVGLYRRRNSILRKILNDGEQICNRSQTLRSISDKELGKRLKNMRVLVRRRKTGFAEIIPEALALIVETSHRTLGLRPFPVQVAGALTLYNGYLAEMATGEGKSLTACLSAVLSAWSGRPCHIVTVNDYLAKRDALEMKSFYSFCGVTTGCVTSVTDPRERKQNYGMGVVYTTSKEIVADFLRDRLIIGDMHHPTRRLIRQFLFPGRNNIDGLVLRGLDTVIVDEADSVLIDEAVTPLIISQPQKNKLFTEVYDAAGRIARSLEPGEDYTADLKFKEITLKNTALEKIRPLAKSLPGIWANPVRSEELIKQALAAREFYHRDKEYVIRKDRVVIVDEFTGRLMPDRSWRQGFHQAVEAKEGLELSDPSETMARISFQQFFRLFRKISGMTGTAKEAAGEFWQIYGLPVLKIPTNRPCIRTILPDRVFETADEKWQGVKDEIIRIHRTGRPVLVGTRNVYASEKLARMLTAERLEFNLLNAVHHEEEAGIVRVAGEERRITIATNMAGRGTDIKLHGRVSEMGGLYVIATERHESGRIDRQLFGRCARQGDPGTARAFISVEDELIDRFIPAAVKNRLKAAVKNKIPGASGLAKKIIVRAQKSAQNLSYQQRKSVLRMDTWLEEALSFSGRGRIY